MGILEILQKAEGKKIVFSDTLFMASLFFGGYEHVLMFRNVL